MATALLVPLALVSVLSAARQSAPVAAPPQDPPDRRCHIHGRVLDEGGVPVAGARIVAHGWGANQQRVERYGLPAQWSDPEVQSGEDGGFALRFVPPQAFQFTLEVQHDSFADHGWRWGQIAEGEERAMGDVTLARPGVIEGHLATPTGDLLVEQWFVQASLASRLAHHEGISTKHSALDPATGAFRFDDLPPGRVVLQPVRRTGERGAEVVVTTSAEVVTEAVLVYDGPDPARRILLHISSSGPTGLAAGQLAAGAVRAVAVDGAVVPFLQLESRGWEYWATNLSPGEYRVEIDDPRFEPWEREGVRPGESVRASLMGRAKLRASVLGPDGEPVPSYRLTIRQTAPMHTSHFEELQSAATAPPPDGVYRGLLEGSYDVRVTAAGFGEHRATVDGLTAGVEHELIVRLARLRPLRGRVVHGDGSPVASGTIQVTSGDVAGHDGDPSSTVFSMMGDGSPGSRDVTIPYRDATARLEADGAFDLGGVAAAPAVVRVLIGDWIRHDVSVDIAALSEPLVVTVPRLGSVVGRVSFAGELPPGDLYLRPERAHHDHLRTSAPDAEQAGSVGADGRFQLGPLLAGAQVLELVAIEHHGDDELEGRSWSSRHFERVRVDIAPGAPTTYDFDLGLVRPTTRVALTFTFAGEPAMGPLEVQLVPCERFDASGREVERAYAQCVGDRCVVERVAAGRHTVIVSHPGLWSHSVAEPVEVTVGQVAAGEVPHCSLDLPVHWRDLRILAADGTPHATSAVCIGSTAWGSRGIIRTTFADGTLTLALPTGRYAAHTGPRESMAEFDWAAGQDPLEVRLPAR